MKQVKRKKEKDTDREEVGREKEGAGEEIAVEVRKRRWRLNGKNKK